MNMMMIQSLTEAVGWTLLHFVWQGAIAVVVLWILLKVLTENSSQVRYVISCSVLLLLATGSGLTLLLNLDFSRAHADSKAVPKAFRTELAELADIRLLEPNKRPQVKLPEEIATSQVPVVTTPPPEKPVPVLERLNRFLSPWLSWIVGFWMAGVMILSIRLMNAWRMTRKMVRSGKPLEDSEWEQRFDTIKQHLKIKHPVSLLTSASTTVPVVIGWLKPTVLLPGSVLTGLHSDQLEAVLFHELAHIRRHDYLVNILQNVMEILFFYHPGLKWISKQVRLERECCCDEIAARHSGGAVHYAKALTALIQLPPEQPPAPALAASGSSLLTRIKRLIKSEQSDLADAPGSGIIMTVLIAALILLPLIFSMNSGDVNAEIKPKDSLNKKEVSETDSKTTPENKTEEDNSEYEGGGRISGEIVFEDGTPANVEGALYGYSKRGNSTIHSTIDSKTTKLDNTFSAGKVWIKFYPKGYAPTWAGPFDLKKDQEIKGVKLVLKKGFSSTLKLTSEKGQPIPDAIVFKYPVIKTDKHHQWRGGPNYILKTDPQGLLKLEHLAELPYDFTITAPGYETLRELDITPEANETFTLKMTPAEPTTGTVFNHDGSPAPDAKLYLRIEMNNLKHDHRSYSYGSGNIATTTDENGNFVLDQLSQKCRYRFIVKLRDGSRFVLDDLLPGTKNNKLTAPEPKELKIRLIGDLGQITKWKGNRVIEVRQRSRFQVVEDENYGDLIYDRVPVTPTEDGGEVNWKGILPGKATIRVGDIQKEVDVNETGVTEVTIDLPEKKTSAKVLNPDGTPAPKARFLLWHIAHGPDFKKKTFFNAAELFAETDENGLATFKKMKPEDRYLFLLETADQHRMIVPDIIPGKSNQSIQLPKRRDVKIKIIGDVDDLYRQDWDDKRFVQVIQSFLYDKKPLEEGEVRINQNAIITPTKEGATAVLKGALPGRITLGYPGGTKIVDVNKTGDTEVTLELPEKKKVAQTSENTPEANQNADTQNNQKKTYPSDPSLPAPEKVIEQLEKAVGTIRNFDVYVTSRHQELLKLVSNKDNNPIYRKFYLGEDKPEAEFSYYRQAYGSPLPRRVEKFHIPFKFPESISVLNLKQMVTHDPERGHGSIEPIQPQIMPHDDYGCTFQNVMMTAPWTYILKDRKTTHVEKDPVHPNMIVIDAPVDKNSIYINQYGFRALLDPKVGMLPVYTEMYQIDKNGQKLVLNRSKIKHAKNKDNLTVPVGMITILYSPAGQPIFEAQLKVDMKRSRWNVDFEDNVFTLKYPEGTVVEDRVHQLKIVTGPGESNASLLELIDTAQSISPVNVGQPLDQEKKEELKRKIRNEAEEFNKLLKQGPHQKKQTNLLKYDDNSPDGKKSIAGTGHLIRFSLPEKSQQLKGLSIHAARYGYPKAPEEDVEVSVVSEDETDLIHTELVPYSRFDRGESRWHEIEFEDPIDVPENFKVIFNFNAEQTKGVYVSYDTSTGGTYSKTALPGAPSQDPDFKGDWMIRAILTPPEQN